MKKLFSLEMPKKGNPASLLNQAFEANRYLALFDTRVIWVKGKKRPFIFDVALPYALPKGAIVTLSYLQGFRVTGIDRFGWVLRCMVIPPDEREREAKLTDQGIPDYLIDRIERY